MRKNPTLTTERTGLKLPSGIDLTLAAGVSSENLAEANKMPDVNMSPNNGDNPSIPDAPFADGKDLRNKEGGTSSNPNPGKVGC